MRAPCHRATSQARKASGAGPLTSLDSTTRASSRPHPRRRIGPVGGFALPCYRRWPWVRTSALSELASRRAHGAWDRTRDPAGSDRDATGCYCRMMPGLKLGWCRVRSPRAWSGLAEPHPRTSRPGAAGRRPVAGAVCRHGPAAGDAVHARSVLAGPAADGGVRLILGRGGHRRQRQGVRAPGHAPGRGWRSVSAGAHGGAGGVRDTRSAMPSWTGAGWARPRWPCGWPARAGRGCWCRPTGSGTSSRRCPTGPGCRARTRQAIALPGGARSGSGWSPTHLTIPAGRRGRVPAGHRPARPPAVHGRRAGRALRPTVGGGGRSGRDQDPPARPAWC
jgi:hypothetical protein